MIALFSALDVRCALLVTETAEMAAKTPLTGALPRVPETASGERILAILKEPGCGAVSRVKPEPYGKVKVPSQPPLHGGGRDIILLGASTGGVDALLTVLGRFPADCPPTLIVQHTGGRFAAGLIRLLNSACAATVRPAVEGDLLVRGQILMAPGGERHLGIAAGDTLRCHLEAGVPICGHRPSVDALFRSALPVAARTTAALLTGMGRDGAEGLLALRRAGATTLAQDAESSVVYGMPRVAWEIGAAERQVALGNIAGLLLQPKAQPAGAAR